MRSDSPSSLPQRGFFDIFDQLNEKNPLMALSKELNRAELESCFSPLYSEQGREGQPNLWAVNTKTAV